MVFALTPAGQEFNATASISMAIKISEVAL
jgi:hypothetical protein